MGWLRASSLARGRATDDTSTFSTQFSTQTRQSQQALRTLESQYYIDSIVTFFCSWLLQTDLAFLYFCKSY